MGRTIARLIVPSLLVALALPAAEQPPMMELLVSDGPRLLQRWETSLYAKLWNDRVMEANRAKVAEQLAAIEASLGVTLKEVLASLATVHLRVDDLTTSPAGAANAKPEALVSMQADLGQLATRIMTLALEKDPDSVETIVLAGADQAMRRKPTDDKSADAVVLARYGSRLVVSNRVEQPKAWTVTPSEADLSFTIDSRSFMIKAAEQAKNDPDQQMVFAALMNAKGLDAYLTPLTWEMTLVPEGIHERMRQDVVCPWLKPVDRALFARLPEKTLMAMAFGFDSQSYWNLLEPMMLDLLAKQQPGMNREQLVSMVDEQLAGLGMPLTFPDLVQAINGTVLIAVTPGAPFPAITVAVPRSKAVDHGLRFAAATQQWEIPAEGTSGPLPIPNVPLPVTLIADKGYWVITSDPHVATTWNAGGSGWSTSPAMTLAFEKAGADAPLISASDTGAVLRTAGGFLALVPIPDAKDKQTATVLLARAAAAASTGYLVGRQRGKTWELEARGIMGLGSVPLLSAAIAIPNLLETRAKASEVAVVSLLRSGVFPAQIQFQAGAYVDQNGDNIGEYGFLSEMAGGAITGQPDTLKLSLLPEVWNAAQPAVHGYRFACWLPDGKGGALGANDGLRAQNAAAAKAQSERFVVYAWSTNNAGKAVYALTHTGTIYSNTGVTMGANGPAWNALFDGAGWENDPTWEPHRRR